MVTLKKGSRGQEVKILQKALNLLADGIFGPLTEEGVKAFQQSKGLVVDGIVGPKTWAALGITDTTTIGNLKKSTRNITEIIVHCAATPEGKDYTVAQIRQCHLQRGFSDIGYNYVIYRDGSIHEGRNVNISGAHTVGHNYNSIGICYIGGCAKDGKTPKDTRTEAQKASLVKLIKDLKRLYPKATIHGHCEYANKACPAFNAKEEYKNL